MTDEQNKVSLNTDTKEDIQKEQQEEQIQQQNNTVDKTQDSTEEKKESTNPYDFDEITNNDYQQWLDERNNQELQLKKQYLEEKKQGKTLKNATPAINEETFQQFYKKTREKERLEEQNQTFQKQQGEINQKGKQKYGGSQYRASLSILEDNGIAHKDVELINQCGNQEDIYYLLGKDEKLAMDFINGSLLQKANILNELKQKITPNQNQNNTTQNNTNQLTNLKSDVLTISDEERTKFLNNIEE